MAIGPTQLLIVLGLERSDFHEALVIELEHLHNEGIVRLVDALALCKDEDGRVAMRQLNAHDEGSIGTDCGAEVLEEIPTGSSAALILIEHHWAWRLHDVIAALGGFAISDGFIISPLDWLRPDEARSAEHGQPTSDEQQQGREHDRPPALQPVSRSL
jgi:hypothetical protein